MRKLLILTILVLFAAGQAWADCAWVLIKRDYSKQTNHVPKSTAYSYYDSQSACDTARVKITQVNIKDLAKNYECIPSNVLNLYVTEGADISTTFGGH
jgi:hypothetical protein